MSEPTLDEQLAYLATALLGWAKDYYAGMNMWNDGGSLYYHAEESRGPLSLYARLLSGDGMLEIIEAMRTAAWHVTLDSEQHGEFSVHFTHVGYYDSDPIRGSEVVYAESLPEAVARAAYQALQETA